MLLLNKTQTLVNILIYDHSSHNCTLLFLMHNLMYLLKIHIYNHLIQNGAFVGNSVRELRSIFVKNNNTNMIIFFKSIRYSNGAHRA